MSRRKLLDRQRGYSLMEIMVVIAIIGILSLVTVPAFMNYQRRNHVRTALRTFTGDLRSFRQFAITKNVYVRVEFETSRKYTAWQSTNLGKTWDVLPLGTLATGSNERVLPPTIEFRTNSYNDSDTDTFKDIDFRPDGTTGDFVGSTATPGSFTLKTEWADIINQIVVDVSTTGQLTTKESKAP